MNDSQKRALRGLIQSVPAAFVITGWNLFSPHEWHLNAEQATWLTVLLGALVGYAQNRLEDTAVIRPAFYNSLAAKRGY